MITKKKHLANLDTNPTHQSDSLSQFARRRRHRELKISFLNPTQTRRYINTFRTSTISTCHLYTKTHSHQAPASRVSANFFLPRACSQCVHTIYSRYTMYTFETSFFSVFTRRLTCAPAPPRINRSHASDFVEASLWSEYFVSGGEKAMAVRGAKLLCIANSPRSAGIVTPHRRYIFETRRTV